MAATAPVALHTGHAGKLVVSPPLVCLVYESIIALFADGAPGAALARGNGNMHQRKLRKFFVDKLA